MTDPLDEPPRRPRQRIKPVRREIGDDWHMPNSPYSFEGEVNGLARFATGVRTSSPGMKRTIGLVVVASILGPVAIGFLWTGGNYLLKLLG